jgi:hypothetical protein
VLKLLPQKTQSNGSQLNPRHFKTPPAFNSGAKEINMFIHTRIVKWLYIIYYSFHKGIYLYNSANHYSSIHFNELMDGM